MSFAGEALARSGGNQGGGCVGCHTAGDPSLSLTPDREVLTPGEEAVFTLTVSSSGANAAGVFVDAEGVGAFRTLADEGLAEVEAGLTHFQAKAMSGGSVSFRFAWTPPDAPGGVYFGISAVAANGDGRSSGDAAVQQGFDFVYGCEPYTFYADLDGDGAGREARPRVNCVGAAPEGLAPTGDDCNDNNASIYPGAEEYCNNVDDNCNGEVDEDSLPVEQYPDADGDGYYSVAERSSGEVVVGCLEPGFAILSGDCQPENADIHPAAEEICNQLDDDCDGSVDEGVRPQCGEGWCLRDADTCDGSICTPGPPREEVCNLFDDDCDGEVDEGAKCADGETCVAGLCRPDLGGVGGDAGSLTTTGSSAASDGEVPTSAGRGGTASGGDSKGSDSAGGCAVQRAPVSCWPFSLAGLALLVGSAWARRRVVKPRG